MNAHNSSRSLCARSGNHLTEEDACEPIDERLVDKSNVLTFVSVIVPVYNDARLALCLDALAKQSYPAERFEVIVIDNGATQTIVLSGVAVLHEPDPGSYGARNRGILAARGDVLAFTDADCIPDQFWLEAGIERLHQKDAPDMIGGAIQLFPLNLERLTAAELFESVWGFPQRVFVEEMSFAATANLFVRRDVFNSVGLFNKRMMSGGDVEWGKRTHRFGMRMVYSDKALVHHPSRRSLAELIVKYRRTCGGKYQLRLMNREGHGAALAKLFRRPFVALYSENDLNFIRQRLRYVGVEFLLSGVQLFELARLTCGGKPRRR